MRQLVHVCSLAAAIATISATPAFAQTTAAGPYYAVPSWDQTIACTASANCPRFVVLSNMNNDAVLDRETGSSGKGAHQTNKSKELSLRKPVHLWRSAIGRDGESPRFQN